MAGPLLTERRVCQKGGEENREESDYRGYRGSRVSFLLEAPGNKRAWNF